MSDASKAFCEKLLLGFRDEMRKRRHRDVRRSLRANDIELQCTDVLYTDDLELLELCFVFKKIGHTICNPSSVHMTIALHYIHFAPDGTLISDPAFGFCDVLIYRFVGTAATATSSWHGDLVSLMQNYLWTHEFALLGYKDDLLLSALAVINFLLSIAARRSGDPMFARTMASVVARASLVHTERGILRSWHMAHKKK